MMKKCFYFIFQICIFLHDFLSGQGTLTNASANNIYQTLCNENFQSESPPPNCQVIDLVIYVFVGEKGHLIKEYLKLVYLKK